ncbi:hypothetical protein PTSG_07633 [Salpingoeca rosetta]|uniref:Apple domain-containing protein n=1 Tax=Salpingoeca rosetta (strain ATCC 50818 / BSB-021) TaxID=946362 RepID=F2UHB7_SALR5|nr:uncharacterized protein PTSG_07633 [Salpingoeca rosetta]EGD76516.1 hypothetical protein PTSG_07633 [Salpingoeca rosetta]|eukprot:XP_004991430.1 hypothetical protein PTSG_07633 [Salpingoeca rosetta]
MAGVAVAQSGWSRNGASAYHRLLFTAPSPAEHKDCAQNLDTFAITNHALSRLNFYRRWAEMQPIAYNAQLMADAQSAAESAPAAAGDGITITELSATQTSVQVKGDSGALALDSIFNTGDGTTVRSMLLSQDLQSFGVGTTCQCGQELTVLLLQHPATPSSASADSWVAWPPHGWLPYTALPHSNLFSFHWPGVAMDQATVTVMDGYGLQVASQIIKRTPTLVFSVNYNHRRLYEDMTLHVQVDTNVVSAAHPEVVSFSSSIFDPDARDLCCYHKLTLSTSSSSGQMYAGVYAYSHQEQFLPVYVRLDNAYILYYTANRWRIAALGASLDARTDVATAFAPAVACPADIEAHFISVACPLTAFSFDMSCNKPLSTTPFPTTTAPPPPPTTTTPDDGFSSSTTWTSTSSSTYSSTAWTTWEPTSEYDGNTVPPTPSTALPPGHTTSAVPSWPFEFPDPDFAIVFIGADLGSTSPPQQFTTAFDAAHLLFIVQVPTTGACTQACINYGDTCKGVFLYTQGGVLVCRALAHHGDLWSGAPSTFQSLSLRRVTTSGRNNDDDDDDAIVAGAPVPSDDEAVKAPSGGDGGKFEGDVEPETQPPAPGVTTAVPPTENNNNNNGGGGGGSSSTDDWKRPEFMTTSPAYEYVHTGAVGDGLAFTTAINVKPVIKAVDVANADDCVHECDAREDCAGVFLFVVPDTADTLRCHVLSAVGDDGGMHTSFVSVSLRRKSNHPSAVHAAVTSTFGHHDLTSWAVEAVGALPTYAQGLRFDSVLADDGSSNGVVTHESLDSTLAACLNWCRANPATCARVYVVPASTSFADSGSSSSSSSSATIAAVNDVSCRMLGPATNALASPAFVPTSGVSASLRLIREGETVVDVFGDVRPEFELRFTGGAVATSLSRQFSTAPSSSSSSDGGDGGGAVIVTHAGASALECMAACVADDTCAGVYAWVASPSSPVQCALLSDIGTVAGDHTTVTSISLAKR